MTTLISRSLENTQPNTSKHQFNATIGKGGHSSSLAPKKKPSNITEYKNRNDSTKVNITHSEFHEFYERGDLPVSVAFEGVTRKVQWKINIDKLDYSHYLPIFIDGIREIREPYKFLARQGTYDLLSRNPSKILACVPQCIIPLKTNLNTRDHNIVCDTLKVIQKLVLSSSMIGEALVPYYRQLLPIFNLLYNKNISIGDNIDYGQQKRENIGDLIQETLEYMELYGGKDAFINIKYMIPTYESQVVR